MTSRISPCISDIGYEDIHKWLALSARNTQIEVSSSLWSLHLKELQKMNTLNEMKPNRAEWMDDTFKDPMVARDNLKVLCYKLQLEVEE